MPEPLHLAHQLAAAHAEASLGIRALRIDAGAVVAGPDGAEPISVGALEMRRA